MRCSPSKRGTIDSTRSSTPLTTSPRSKSRQSRRTPSSRQHVQARGLQRRIDLGLRIRQGRL
eukprot:2386772-Pyramimonas_sp.AAC.1